MKKITLFSICIILSAFAFGQEAAKKVFDTAKHVEVAPDTVKPWTFGGFGSLSVNQAYFANWAAGGESSLGITALLNVHADYKKGHHSWTNNLDLAFGYMDNAIASAAEQMRKTDDRIEFTTAYGYGISKHWDLTALVNLRTQFAAGYKYPNDSTVISNFMSPGYLIGGLGVTWKPAASFAVFISPLAARMTFVTDRQLSDSSAFGVDSSKHVKTELGAYVRMTLNQDIAKNINISSTLDLYSNYLKNFGNIDVNWNVLITMKVTKWMATTISTSLIYDDDVKIHDLQGKTGPRTQFKENIGVGLSYKIH